MTCLPLHGRVSCRICHSDAVVAFDETRTTEGDWRITFNPLSWGTSEPEIVVLGFSKGPTQAGALANSPHDEIAYKGSRLNIGKILAHLGLISSHAPDKLRRHVDTLIADRNGRFHFGSLVRCTVERLDRKAQLWKGTGGGMLDRFVGSSFGARVTSNCASQFLKDLPQRTKLVVMFGLGTRLNYVRESLALFRRVRPGRWTELNDVAYTDGRITVVHVEHFAAQGALIPNWLGERAHARSELGRQAREAVRAALSET